MHDRRYWKITIALLVALPIGMKLNQHLWREAAPLSGADRPSHWAQPLALSGVGNLHRVSDDLYRGEQPSPEGKQALYSLGIRTIFNLRSFHSDRDEIGRIPLKYEHVTMKAWHPEDKEIVAFLKTVTDPAQTPVFVHCQHGSDRTGTMCAVYRIAVEGWSREDAIDEMTRGGFGYHATWSNLISYLRNLDFDAICAAAGVSPAPPIDRDPRADPARRD